MSSSRQIQEDVGITSINIQLQMLSGSISNSHGFTSAISIQMIEFELLQIRLSMDTIPIHCQTRIDIHCKSKIRGQDMMGNKSKSVSFLFLAQAILSSITFTMNFMKLSASSVKPRRIKAYIVNALSRTQL